MWIENLIPTKSGSVIPINSTVAALDTTPNYTITSTANTIAIPAGCSKVEIIPDSIPAVPIYIKRSFWTATDATTTTYDQKVCECKPLAEFAIANNCSHISLVVASGSYIVSVIFS